MQKVKNNQGSFRNLRQLGNGLFNSRYLIFMILDEKENFVLCIYSPFLSLKID